MTAAHADRGDDVLQAMLATDDGARRLGELGIGTNFGIDRAVGSILFDEKIGGTVHLALGPLLSRDRRHERVGGPLGHDLRPAPRRPAERRRRADRRGRRAHGRPLTARTAWPSAAATCAKIVRAGRDHTRAKPAGGSYARSLSETSRSQHGGATVSTS